MKNSVSVIIPNYNGEKLLEKNLSKVIEAWKNLKNNIKEIIIVDDGSVDSSVKFVNSTYPEVRLIKHKINRGFPAAVNTGVRASNGDLILLLNTDVLPERNFLESVFSHFKDKKVFAVSLHEMGYGFAKGCFKNGYIELKMGEEKESSCESFYVSGGSGVFKKRVWAELGGMDERLLSPFYWEDIDLCYRAYKKGYICLWEPNAKVVHNHESTINRLPKVQVQKIRERNQLLMLWKNIHSISFMRKHFAGLFSRLIRHPGYIRVVAMALGRLGIVIQRRQREIKESRISDEVIFDKFN